MNSRKRQYCLLSAAIVVAVLVLIERCDAGSVGLQSLDGDQWIASNGNGSIHVASRVPGSIYSDLLRARAIEDIYANFNDIRYRWVAYENWTFTRRFDVDKNILQRKHVYLTAHGLDTIGEIYLNGRFLSTTDNMFVRYRWPVKKLLAEKQNSIMIRFRSAPEFAKQYYIETMMKKYIIPPVCTPKSQSGECHVNFLRKMQASFSWDWGPAFPTQGIWQPIELEAFDDLVIRSVSIDTQPEHTGQWLLNATVHFEGETGQKASGNLTLYLNNTLLSEHQFAVRFDEKGEASTDVFVLVPDTFDIKPWYPNGVGSQHLYPLTVVAETETTTMTNRQNFRNEKTSKSIKIGFRTVRIVQERLPSRALAFSFYFEINGLPIFAKGSNWIPAHVLPELQTEAYIRDLLLSAKLANMNMLRVWGGGIYESDRFYELADEYGILIWQDMMFACALYPTDPRFLLSVSDEVRQQVRRLQHHPSIAVWAGNNENEQAIAQMWWPEVAIHFEKFHEDYRTLYIRTMMPLVESEDRSRPFLSSSPSNGIMSARDGYISGNPQSSQFGDMHFYTDSGDVWQWTKYPSTKFASEYGFQSWSSLQTLKRYLPASTLRYPLDDVFVHREHKTNELQYLNDMMMQNLPLPSNGSEARLADYIYLTQVHQAMAIKIESEFYRRNREVSENGDGHTMGALYWQLNDIWPTVSWSSIEFGGKWKLLHYYARNMFDNLLVNAWLEGDRLRIAVIRDDHINQTITFAVKLSIYDWSSTTPLHDTTFLAATQPFSVTHVFRQDVRSVIEAAKCVDRDHCFAEVAIEGDFQGHTIRRKNFLLLGKIKDAIGLRRTQIAVKHITGPAIDMFGVKTFRIELESDHIAAFVYLDFAETRQISGIFSDNGFMMTGNQTNVMFKTRENVTKTQLANSLTIRSLKDVE